MNNHYTHIDRYVLASAGVETARLSDAQKQAIIGHNRNGNTHRALQRKGLSTSYYRFQPTPLGEAVRDILYVAHCGRNYNAQVAHNAAQIKGRKIKAAAAKMNRKRRLADALTPNVLKVPISRAFYGYGNKENIGEALDGLAEGYTVSLNADQLLALVAAARG